MKKIHKKNHHDSENTISRILLSATELFSVKGFHKTSIQEITDCAKCNVSCVNYYYHGKERLYKEVFKNQISDIIHLLKHPNVNEKNNHSNILENDLHSAVNIFMSPSGHPTLLMGLIYHEMTDPHLPNTFFVNEVLLPLKKHLNILFQQNLPSLEYDSANLCVLSFAGQLLHLVNIIHLFKLSNHSTHAGFDTNRAIQHIIEFSAAGAIHLSIKDQIHKKPL
jgi:AcrR family transcriptional regulator